MGIYDREYYRREGPSFLEAITRHGQVCKWLIIINVVAFFLQLATNPGPPQFDEDEYGNPVRVDATPAFSVTKAFELDTDQVKQGQVWRLLTYAFLHAGLWHIFFNMLFLWWFGSQMEDLYGSREFLIFYLVAAVLGGIVFQLTAMAHVGPHLCIGASGAVTAALVLFAFHYPRQIIYVWFFPIPIWLLVVFEVGQDLFGFLNPGSAGNTAVTVHLAGALFAFVYYKSDIRLWSFVPDFSAVRRLSRRSNLRIYREEPRRPVAVGTQSTTENSEHFEAKVDAVLEKVARYGQSSLSESEREILNRASELYKRRRS
jgi:membrane associated rhomboid family serine protease